MFIRRSVTVAVFLLFVVDAVDDNMEKLAERAHLTVDELQQLMIGFKRRFTDDAMYIYFVQIVFSEKVANRNESRKFVRKFFDTMDENRNGRVDILEYLESSALYLGNRRQQLTWFFSFFDSEKHGYIHEDDLFDGIRAIVEMDERSSNDSSDSSIRSESQRIFKRLDVNGDGHLTFIDDGFGDIIEQVDENSTDAALLSSYNGYMRCIMSE